MDTLDENAAPATDEAPRTLSMGKKGRRLKLSADCRRPSKRSGERSVRSEAGGATETAKSGGLERLCLGPDRPDSEQSRASATPRSSTMSQTPRRRSSSMHDRSSGGNYERWSVVGALGTALRRISKCGEHRNLEDSSATRGRAVSTDAHHQFQPDMLLSIASTGPPALVETLVLAAQRQLAPAELAPLLSQALCVSSEAGLAPVVKLLLEQGADAYVTDPDYYTPLMLAAESGSTAAVRELLEDDGGRTSLHTLHPVTGLPALGLACGTGNASVVRELLGYDAPVDGAIVAHAVACGHTRLVPLLVRASRWRQGELTSGLQMQRHLRALDPDGRAGVKREMLTDVLQMETAQLVEAFVHGFRNDPYEAFSDAVFLAEAFMAEATDVRMRDRFRADQLNLQSVRVQHVACGLLRSLYRTNSYFVDLFLAAEEAMRTVRAAARAECKVLLALPEVQHHLQWRWRGLQEGSVTWYRRLLLWLFWPLVLLCAAIYPPLWGLHLVLPPSPRARFFAHAISDIMLSMLLLLIPPPVKCESFDATHFAWSSTVLLWAISGLVCETRELHSGLVHAKADSDEAKELTLPEVSMMQPQDAPVMVPPHQLLRPHSRAGRSGAHTARGVVPGGSAMAASRLDRLTCDTNTRRSSMGQPCSDSSKFGAGSSLSDRPPSCFLPGVSHSSNLLGSQQLPGRSSPETNGPGAATLASAGNGSAPVAADGDAAGGCGVRDHLAGKLEMHGSCAAPRLARGTSRFQHSSRNILSASSALASRVSSFRPGSGCKSAAGSGSEDGAAKYSHDTQLRTGGSECSGESQRDSRPSVRISAPHSDRTTRSSGTEWSSKTGRRVPSLPGVSEVSAVSRPQRSSGANSSQGRSTVFERWLCDGSGRWLLSGTALVLVAGAAVGIGLLEVFYRKRDIGADFRLGAIAVGGGLVLIAIAVVQCAFWWRSLSENLAATRRALAADPWRVLGLLAYVVSIMAMALRVPLSMAINDHPDDVAAKARDFTAAAVALVVLRHMRLLYLYSSIGPLVLMIFRVMADLAKFITIAIVVLVAFTGALFTLFRGGDAPVCADSHHELDDFRSVFVMLLEFSVNSEADFSCVANSHDSFMGQTILISFMVLMCLLLMNMLIAMMAKTYDDVREAQEANFMFLCVDRVIKAEDAEPVPPPLNLFSAPFWLIRSCAALFVGRFDVCTVCCASSAARMRLPTVSVFVRKESGSDQTLGWLDAFKEDNTAEATALEVLSYTVFHEDEVVEEGKWRTRFAQKLSRTRMDLENVITPLEQQFAAVRETLDSIRAEQHLLGQRVNSLMPAASPPNVQMSESVPTPPPHLSRSHSGSRHQKRAGNPLPRGADGATAQGPPPLGSKQPSSMGSKEQSVTSSFSDAAASAPTPAPPMPTRCATDGSFGTPQGQAGIQRYGSAPPATFNEVDEHGNLTREAVIRLFKWFVRDVTGNREPRELGGTHETHGTPLATPRGRGSPDPPSPHLHPSRCASTITDGDRSGHGMDALGAEGEQALPSSSQSQAPREATSPFGPSEEKSWPESDEEEEEEEEEEDDDDDESGDGEDQGWARRLRDAMPTSTPDRSCHGNNIFKEVVWGTSSTVHIPLRRERSANELPRTTRQQLASCVMLTPSDRDERLMVGSHFASSRASKVGSRAGSVCGSCSTASSAAEQLGWSPLLDGQRMSAASARVSSYRLYDGSSSRPSGHLEGVRERGSSHDPRSTTGSNTDRFSVECRPRGSSAGPRMMYSQCGSSCGKRGSSFNGASCPSLDRRSRNSRGDRVSFSGVQEESPRSLQQEAEQEMEEQERQMQQGARDLADVSASELSAGIGIDPTSSLTRVHVPVIEEAAAVEVAYDEDDAASEASIEVTAVELASHAAEVEARPSLDQESSKPASPQRISIPRLSLPGSSPRRSTLEEPSPMSGSQQFRRGSNCFAAEL